MGIKRLYYIDEKLAFIYHEKTRNIIAAWFEGKEITVQEIYNHAHLHKLYHEAQEKLKGGS